MSIPHHVKASQALARSERYSGELDPAQLPRLRPELGGESSPVSVDFRLQRDAAGDWLRGSVRASLKLQCQRCLNAFGWRLETHTELRLVYSDAQEQQVLEDADPYRVEDDRLPLREIVEDEVLLALPMMPRCGLCEAAAPELTPPPEVQAEEPSARTNPFAALKNDAMTGAGPRRK